MSPVLGRVCVGAQIAVHDVETGEVASAGLGLALIKWPDRTGVIQPLAPKDTAAVLKMIQHFLGKGTAIGLALGVAVQQVRELAQKGHKGADLLLVTDGIDDDEQAQTAAIQEAQALGARLWTVAIECDIDARSPLRAKAAHYIRVGRTDLSEGKSVRTLSGAA